MTGTIEVVDRGRRMTFGFEDVLRYHGHESPGGAALGFKVLERALRLLDPDAPCERREIVVATAFGALSAGGRSSASSSCSAIGTAARRWY